MGNRNSTPNIATEASTQSPMVSADRPTRSSRRSTAGSRRRHAQATYRMSSTRPPHQYGIARTDHQPWAGASVVP
jgi:hypothetical protein